MKKLLALACLLAVLGTGAEAVEYRIHDLGTFVDGWNCSAVDLNNSGQVVGTASSLDGQSCYAFIWENGLFTPLGALPEEDYSEATSINEQGQVCGAGHYQAFMWENGMMTKLSALAGEYGMSRANSINDSGQIAGISSTAGGSRCAAVWHNGEVADLGGFHGLPRSINNNGQVVGDTWDQNGIYAAMWENGSSAVLELFGGNRSTAQDINDRGQIVGVASGVDFGGHAFLYEAGIATYLGSFGGYISNAYGINELGHIVGFAETLERDGHAFVWQNGVMTDLGTLGGSGSCAYAINDNGWICGTAQAADHISHAVLWEPVPEPSSILALISGLGGLGLAVRRRAGRA